MELVQNRDQYEQLSQLVFLWKSQYWVLWVKQDEGTSEEERFKNNEN